MKPALALILVLGVNALSTPTGLAGLLAGVGLLLVALFAPFTIYRLLAFVDPGTNAGAATRSWLAGTRARRAAAADRWWRRRRWRWRRGGRARVPVRRRGPADPAAGSGAGVRWRRSGGGAPRPVRRSGAAGVGAVAGGPRAGAAVAAAGQFAGQYAGRTMDASGIGYPHGGGGPAARRWRGRRRGPRRWRRSGAPRPAAGSGGDPGTPAGPVVEPSSYDHAARLRRARHDRPRLRRPGLRGRRLAAAGGPVRRRPVGRARHRTTARATGDGPPDGDRGGDDVPPRPEVAVAVIRTERTAGGHAMSAASTGTSARSYRLDHREHAGLGAGGDPDDRRACACCSPPRS